MDQLNKGIQRGPISSASGCLVILLFSSIFKKGISYLQPLPYFESLGLYTLAVCISTLVEKIILYAKARPFSIPLSIFDCVSLVATATVDSLFISRVILKSSKYGQIATLIAVTQIVHILVKMYINDLEDKYKREHPPFNQQAANIAAYVIHLFAPSIVQKGISYLQPLSYCECAGIYVLATLSTETMGAAISFIMKK